MVEEMIARKVNILDSYSNSTYGGHVLFCVCIFFISKYSFKNGMILQSLSYFIYPKAEIVFFWSFLDTLS